MITLDEVGNHQYPCKREVEREFSLSRGEGSLTTEAEIVVMWLRTKESQSPKKWEKQGTDSPLEPPEGT